MNNTTEIKFEIGDLVYCPYYRFKGLINEFKTTNDIDYIILKNPKTKSYCSTVLRTDSANNYMPYYLQLICKKRRI